jgi:hypothetical protein
MYSQNKIDWLFLTPLSSIVYICEKGLQHLLVLLGLGSLPYPPLRCRGLPGTNTVGYFAHKLQKRNFIILTPGANVIKHFLSVIYEFL